MSHTTDARDDPAALPLLEDDLAAAGMIEPSEVVGRLGVFHPGVGAPLAAGFLEESIARGFRTFVAVGGAGALVPDLVLGHAVVVHSAVRDAGTSFHYLAPSRTVDADPAGVAALEATLSDAGVPFITGRSWTTDAFYRETRDRVRRRVRFAQLLYAGDSLAGADWDERGWTTATDIRRQLF